jgi:hypothetical protein
MTADRLACASPSVSWTKPAKEAETKRLREAQHLSDEAIRPHLGENEAGDPSFALIIEGGRKVAVWASA